MRNGSRLITQWSIGVAAIFTIPTALAGTLAAGGRIPQPVGNSGADNPQKYYRASGKS
jgi:hypothetical protein